MKTTTAFILTAAMALSFTGCDSSVIGSKACYTSTDEVTLEKLIENSSPSKMVEYKGGFKEVIDYSGSGQENMDDGEFYIAYKKTGDLIEYNFSASYPDEFTQCVYVSTNKDDPYRYTQTPMGITRTDLTDEERDHVMSNTVLGYVGLDPKLEEVTEKDGNYIAKVSIIQDGQNLGTDTITLDPKSGMILKVKSNQPKGLEVISEFSYAKNTEINTTPQTDYVEPVEATENPEVSAEQANEAVTDAE
jgi:hypothetical protein